MSNLLARLTKGAVATSPFEGLEVAQRQSRVQRLDRHWRALLQVIEERAAAYDGEGPGAGTGLLAPSKKSIGSGPAAEIVVSYELDVAVLRELRDIEEQAAKELGQWSSYDDLSKQDAERVVVYLPDNRRNGVAAPK